MAGEEQEREKVPYIHESVILRHTDTTIMALAEDLKLTVVDRQVRAIGEVECFEHVEAIRRELARAIGSNERLRMHRLIPNVSLLIINRKLRQQRRDRIAKAKKRKSVTRIKV